MKSEGDIRYNWSKALGSVNLILHQGIADILHQKVDPLCILGVVEETHRIILACH